MWKNILQFLALFSSIAMAADPKPSTYPDVEEPKLPVVSIRSLNTGAPIHNQHYGERSEYNRQWQIRDVMWQGKPYVQFQALNSNKCLSPGTNVKDCQYYEITMFNLTPTDTGAFILMAYPDGTCLGSTDFGKYTLEHCNRDSLLKGKPVDLTFLWTLTPPFGKTKLLQVPVK